MFETILILAFSSALFVYWFRYTVVLLLAEESAQTAPVLEQLKLAHTRAALQGTAEIPLSQLHLALDKDYRLLRYLLDHAAGLELRPLEQSLLIFDYRLMAAWSMVTRRTSARQSRRALNEMASVLNYISRKMGERALAASHA